MEPEKAAYQVANLTLALTTLAMTNIRAVVGEMELDATLSSRERINSALLTILDGATMPWGVKVSRVEIRKIEPPENLIRAMNLQMTAERERRAVVARADGEREAAIKRAEGEKQALILQAEGRQEAAIRDAAGAGSACHGGGRGDPAGVGGRHALRPVRPALLHRRPLCAGIPGAGIRAEHTSRRGADGVLGTRRRDRAGDAVVPQRQWRPGRRATGHAPAAPTAAAATPDRAVSDAACRRPAGRLAVGDRNARMSDWIIWMAAGLVLLAIEIHAPGAFMMWLGLAACGTGLVVLASGIGFALQVVTCAVLAAIALSIGLRFRHRPANQAQHAAGRTCRPRRHRAGISWPRGTGPGGRQRLGGARAGGRRGTGLRLAAAGGGGRRHRADRPSGGVSDELG